MSIYGAMYSGVSGLAAQSNALGVISDNISNVNTVGYKGSRATFQTLVTQATTQTTYTPGGVGSRPLQGVDKQGLLQGTSNATDLSISGNGMFVVNEAINPDVGDDVMFTRAGEFRPDEQGNLRNAAGFYLQGWPLNENGNLPAAQQSINSVETVNVSNLSGLPRATDEISIGANLPSGALDNTADGTDATRNDMTVQMFDALGEAHNLTIEFSRLGAAFDAPTAPNDPTDTLGTIYGIGSAGTINIDDGSDTYNIAYTTGTTLQTLANDIDSAVSGGNNNISAALNENDQLIVTHDNGIEFTIDDSGPLLSAANVPNAGSGNPALLKANQWGATIKAPVRADNPSGGNSGLFEDPTTPGTYDQSELFSTIEFNGDGSIASTPAILDEFSISWENTAAAPQGTDADNSDNIAVDFGTANQFDGLTQFDSNFGVNEINQNGLKFGNFTGVNVNDEGTVTAVFDNGRRKDIYQLPIAMFSNFNGLKEVSGNAYLQTRESGDFLLTESGVGGAGNVAPSSVEQSTVDLAEEFTRMITTQRAYSASTKVITTSDEMLQELTQAIR